MATVYADVPVFDLLSLRCTPLFFFVSNVVATPIASSLSLRYERRLFRRTTK